MKDMMQKDNVSAYMLEKHKQHDGTMKKEHSMPDKEFMKTGKMKGGLKEVTAEGSGRGSYPHLKKVHGHDC